MAFDVRKSYRKNNGLRSEQPILTDIGLSLERDIKRTEREKSRFEKEARTKAIERAKQSNNIATSTDEERGFFDLFKKNNSNTNNNSNVNAGTDRTTAINTDKELPSVNFDIKPSNKQEGLTSPLDKYNAGDNRTTAVNNNAIIPKTNNEDKTPTNNSTKFSFARYLDEMQKPTISEKESLNNAKKIMSKYDFSDKAMSILDEYVDKDDESKRAGLWKFENQGSYSGFLMDLSEKFKDETGVTDEEFLNIFESYSRIKHARERKAQQSEYKAMPTGERVVKSFVKAPKNILGGYQGLIGSLQKPSNSELGKDYNSEFFRYTNENIDIRNAQNEEIEKIEDPIVRNLAHFAYNAGVMGVESATAALTGEAGLASFFASGYNSGLQDAENRGLTHAQAQTYALAVGGLEYITEKIPWEGLRNIWAGKAVSKDALKGSIMPYIKAFLKQQGSEASEEIINGIGETIADGLISGDKSNLNIKIQYYIQQYGLSEEEATRKAIWDVVKETADNAIIAGVSAGVSAGPALINQAIRETKKGKALGTNKEYIDNALNKSESPDYISENKDDYATEEEYNQAQETRKLLEEAAKKTENNQKLKGQEAREIYENVAQVEENRLKNAAIKAEETTTEAEPNYITKKSNAEALDDVKNAATPYQLASAIETVPNMTEEIEQAIEEKKQDLEMFNFSREDIDAAITPQKAYEMGKEGQELTEEQVKTIPEADRFKALEANHQAYNKQIISEHPDAVADTSTGKFFVPAEVKVSGEDIVIVDTDGIEHKNFTNPRINAAQAVYSLVGKNSRTGKYTNQGIYNTTLQQAAYATELAVKSPEAGIPLIKYALKSIFDTATVGSKSWSQFVKQSNGLFSTINEEAAEKLYNNIIESSRQADKNKEMSASVINEGKVSEGAKQALSEESEALAALTEAFAKKIGVDIKAFTSESQNRGQYQPEKGEIKINTTYANEAWSVLIHEGIGELLQRYNKKDMQVIQDGILEYLEEKLGATEFNQLIDTYQSIYRTDAKKGSVDYNKSRREAANEMVNDTLFALFSTKEGLNDFTDWVTDNKTVAEQVNILTKIKDFFNSLVEYIKGLIDSGTYNKAELAMLEMQQDKAKQLRKQVIDALEQAIKNREIEIAVEEEYKNAVDNDLVNYINGARNNEREIGRVYTLDKVLPNNLKKELESILGFSLEGYSAVIKPNDIRHIRNDHSSDGKNPADKSMENVEDMARVAYAINNFDRIEKSGIDARTQNKDGTKAATVTIQKKIGDKFYYVLEVVPDSAAKELFVKTAYTNKKDTLSQVGTATKSHDKNVRNANAQGVSLSDNSLSPDAKNSIENTLKNSEETVNNEQERKSIAVDSNNIRVVEGYPVNEDIFVQASGEDLNYEEATQTLGVRARKLALINPKYIQMSTWSKIAKEFKKLGYTDITNGNVAKQTFTRLVDNPAGYYVFNDDQAEAIVQIFGINSEKAASDEISEDESKAIAAKAEKQFGTTSNWKLAGYLTVNGKLLDFSEGQGYRVQDHREISEILDLPEDAEYSDGLIEFMAEGNIRLQEYGIDIAVKPNATQKKMLRDFFNKLDGEVTVDFSNKNGDSIGSAEYVEGTSSSRILNDIDSYFDGGDVPEGNIDSINSFRYSKKVDSQGNTLSAEQQKYFKNSKARDENGNLQVVYHGTNNFGFTVFNRNINFYTDVKAVGESYANSGSDKSGVYEGYLKIENPFIVDCHGDRWSGIAINKELQQMIENDGGGVFREKGAIRTSTNDIVSAIETLVDDGEANYDGIIFKNLVDVGGFFNKDNIPGTVYATFNSNQFKNKDNLKPTEDKDIRYSKKVDNLGREVSPAMQQYLKHNADVFYDENGAIKNYYHGTRHAGFTEFMLERMDDKQSIFLTDKPIVAKTYSGTRTLFEPDRPWSFNELSYEIDYMTGGDWEIEQTPSGVRITELGIIGQDDIIHDFKNLKEAQAFFIDWMNSQDFISGGESAGIYNVYVKSSNPLVIDAKNNMWDELPGINYKYHYKDVNISGRGTYEVDFEENGKYKHEYFDSLEALEKKFGKASEQLEKFGSEYYENLYIDEDGNKVPTTTRDFAKYAKENGYDSLVINNVIDSGMFGYSVEQATPSQVVVIFNSNQAKSVYNPNPTADPDIRYSIKVDDERVYTYRGIEIVQNPTSQEYNQMRNDIFDERPWLRGTGEPLFRHTYDEEGNVYYWDALKGLHSQIEPAINKHWNTRTSQQWNWWNDADKDFWPTDYARNSFKVYGDVSPYADSINESKVVTTLLGTMNASLTKADAFEVDYRTYNAIERYIANKYNTNLAEGELAANISYAFAYLQKNKLDSDYESMMNYLLNIGDEVIANSDMKDPLSVEIYDNLKKAFKGMSFKLSEQELAEIKATFGGDWKAAFGSLNKVGIRLNNEKGVPVDELFSQIRQTILEKAGVDIEYANKPSEQLLAIMDTIQALEPTAYLWDGANEMDKALSVVADIVEQYYTLATEQLEESIVKKTDVGKEKIAAAVKKEKAKLKDQVDSYKKTQTENFNNIVAEKNRIIQQQQNQIRAQNEALKKWNANSDSKFAEQQKVLTKTQIERTARLQAKQAVQNYIESQERARQIEIIKKTGIRLIKWLDNPTDAQHVPAFMQRPLAEFLAAIDFLPKNAKADSKSTLAWQQRMNSLRQVIARIREAEAEGDNSPEAYFANNMVAKDILAMLDDFLGKETWDEFTQSYIVTKRTAAKVSALNAEELQQLNKIMSALSTSINNLNKMHANALFSSVDKLAETSFNELKEIKRNKKKQRVFAKYFKDFVIAEKTPIYFFEELGKGAKSVFDELREGWNVRTEHIRDTKNEILEFKKRNNIKDANKWSKNTHTFNLSEGQVTLTEAQIMSLYEIVKRKQGRPHVMLGGIRPADIQGNGLLTKHMHESKAVHINAGDYQKIISVLSDEQIKFADKMQQYMAFECSKWGNRVAEIMYGYKKFIEEDYFPLRTDAYSRGVTPASDNNVSYYNIKNSSFTKQIVPNANNAVMLEDIFDVFTSHVEQMANYDGFVLPIADAMRWFNYSEKVVNATEEGNRVDVLANMQEAIDAAIGEKGNKYFRTFIKNINGIYEGKGGDLAIANAFASRYKAQAVMANLRVVAQQPMAIARASDRIEDRYIMAASAMPSLSLGIAAMKWAKKAQKNSAIAFWKSEGYFETMIGQSMKSIVTGQRTLQDVVNDKAGALAGMADDITWGVIYHAAELKVKHTRPDLTVDSEEFTKEVVKIFEDVIDHTQVVDTIFHKSEVMRSANPATKTLTAFMAEPTLTANIAAHRMQESINSFSNGKPGAAFKTLGKVSRVLITNALMVSFAQSLFDALRDDEPEYDFLENLIRYWFGMTDETKVSDVLLSNFVDNLNPFNWIPVAKEIMSYMQGFDASNMYVESIYSALDSITELVKIAQNDSNKTTYGIIYTVAKGLSQLTGMPFSNAIREVKTVHNNVNDFWQGKDWYTTTTKEEKAEKTIEKKRLSNIFDNASSLSDMKAEVKNTYKQALEAGEADVKAGEKTRAENESAAWSKSRGMLKEQFLRQLENTPKSERTKLINRYITLYQSTKEKVPKKNEFRYMSKEKARDQVNEWYKKAEEEKEKNK